MSIFIIILIALLLACITALIMFGIYTLCNIYHEIRYLICSAILTVCTLITSVFVGIGMADNQERIYVQQYLAQKQVIEQSLKNEDLTGFERIELVNQVVTLNGEFTKRKASYELWHHVHYDNSIYDGVELISLEVE